MKGLKRSPSHLTLRLLDRDGRVLEEWKDLPNLQPDEGETWVLECLFTGAQSLPSPLTYYLGLTTQVSTKIDEETTLATITDGTDGTEPSGNGYARQAILHTEWTISQPGIYKKATSDAQSFAASGGPIPASGAVDWVFLCTAASGTGGKLIVAVALSAPVVILDGQTLAQTIAYGQSE